AELCRLTHPGIAVNDGTWLRESALVFVNARWLPDPEKRPELRSPCVGLVGGQMAFAFLPEANLVPGAAADLHACLDQWKQTLRPVEAGGGMLNRPWDLLERNAEAMEHDWQHRVSRGDPAAPAGLAVVGPRERVLVDAGARVEPMVVVDATKGPVLID